ALRGGDVVVQVGHPFQVMRYLNQLPGRTTHGRERMLPRHDAYTGEADHHYPPRRASNGGTTLAVYPCAGTARAARALCRLAAAPTPVPAPHQRSCAAHPTVRLM